MPGTLTLAMLEEFVFLSSIHVIEGFGTLSSNIGFVSPIINQKWICIYQIAGNLPTNGFLIHPTFDLIVGSPVIPCSCLTPRGCHTVVSYASQGLEFRVRPKISLRTKRMSELLRSGRCGGVDYPTLSSPPHPVIHCSVVQS